jgi:hypothetical protein
VFAPDLCKNVIFLDPEKVDDSVLGVKSDMAPLLPPFKQGFVLDARDDHSFPYVGLVQECPRREQLDEMVRVALVLREPPRDFWVLLLLARTPIRDELRVKGNDIVVAQVYLGWIHASALEDRATRIDRICPMDPDYNGQQTRECYIRRGYLKKKITNIQIFILLTQAGIIESPLQVLQDTGREH